MHPWLAFTSLILLWTDAVVSQVRVSGVAGQPVTLPCTYSTASEVTTMCWGRGECPLSLCSDQLIATDGYRVTFQRNMRYELNGIIPKGNVSLTIKNAQQSDSGTYCCRVEHSGWFNDKKVHILLEIKQAPPKTTSVPTTPRVSTSAPTMPATTLNLTTAPPEVTNVPTSPNISTSPPTMPATTLNLTTAPPEVTNVPTSPNISTSHPTMPATTLNLTTAPPEVTNVPTSPNISTSLPTTPATTLNLTTENTSSSPVQTTETQPTTPQKTYTTSLQSNSCLTDGSGAVAQPSDGVWQHNGTLACLEPTPQLTTNEALYIGISVAAVVLLTILAAIITKKYLCTRKKVLQISKVSSNDVKNEALENAAVVHYRADENIYFDNNVYNTH